MQLIKTHTFGNRLKESNAEFFDPDCLLLWQAAQHVQSPNHKPRNAWKGHSCRILKNNCKGDSCHTGLSSSWRNKSSTCACQKKTMRKRRSCNICVRICYVISSKYLKGSQTLSVTSLVMICISALDNSVHNVPSSASFSKAQSGAASQK